MRTDGRLYHQIRPIHILTPYNKHAEGSVLISQGDTQVICTATIEEKVPAFLKGTGKGWVTAEYAMLPRATHTRNPREVSKGKPTGRTMEIQRLIARALRAVVNLQALGERSVTLDCDVIQADGGTRTTAINGAFIAMAFAIDNLVREKDLPIYPITDFLASVSVGMLDERCMVDLNYGEDSQAQVDMNVVMTGGGRFVELQGTGEQATFHRNQLNDMLQMSEQSIREILTKQKETLGSIASQIRGEYHATQ